MADTLHEPLAFFITFTTYGTWLHGDHRGSVRRPHNRRGMPVLNENPIRRAMMSSKMKHEAMYLDSKARGLVDLTIREVCEHHAWPLHALNVRTNHVHLLVSADCRPEKVMNDVKAWCTRRLREEGLVASDREVWTSHGSTRHLWNEDHVSAARHYIVNAQGADLPRDWPPSRSQMEPEA